MQDPGRLVLLGHPVAHSLSPVFQNAALAACGIALTYETLDVPPASLPAMLGELVTRRAAGNVTIPHKGELLRYCAALSTGAERAGAVNAFRTRADGSLEGTNTDIAGFDALVRSVAADLPACVAVLGAGGGAAAVLAAIEGWRTTRAVVYNRDGSRARALVRRFPLVARTTERLQEALQGADMVVNTTPVGQHDEQHPVSIAALRSNAVVIDLVYRRGTTSWIRAASAAGHAAADGLVMLLEQGARSFEFWFGMEAPRDLMRRALLGGSPASGTGASSGS